MFSARSATDEVIETARLVLVPLAGKHGAALHPLLDDWDVVRMLAVVPWPLSLADVEEFAASAARKAESTDFAVLREGRPIGVCGIRHPGSGEPPRKMPRLGYWLGRPSWGQGLGTEAIGALVGHAFAAFPAAERIGAGVFNDNPASRRLLEKLGFRQVGGYDTPCLSRGGAVATADMQLLRADWVAAEGRGR